MPAPMRNLPAKLTVDFSGVERGGGGAADHIPPGDYVVRVVDCELKAKRDDPSSKYLNWKLIVEQPTSLKGKKLYHVTSLKQEALWNLRGFLMDLLGADKVPQRALDIPLARIVEAKKLIGVTVDDDEYNGKMKSKVQATFPAAEFTNDGASGDDEEDAAPAKSADSDDDLDEIDVEDL